MHEVHYSQSKLRWAAAFLAVCAVMGFGLIGHPESASHSGKAGLLLGSGFGQSFVLPLVVIFCGASAVRMLVLSNGPRAAISIEDDGFTLHTLWGHKKVAWAEYRDASIARTGSGFFGLGHRMLVVRRVKRGKVRLPLGLGKIASGRETLLVELLDLMRTKAYALGREVDPRFVAEFEGEPVRAPVPPPPPSRAPAPPREAERGFDADAALARYMAKKAKGVLEAPGGPPPRAGFGRRGL